MRFALIGGLILCLTPATAGAQVVPEVQAILRAGSSPTNDASVDFTAVFSEDVQGVDPSDFEVAVVDGETSGTAVLAVAGGPATWTVTVDTGTGDGEIRLDLIDDNSITSTTTTLALGGPLEGDGDFTSGETFVVDKTAPTATITLLDPNPTNLDSIRYGVDFDEPVGATFTAADVTRVGQALTGASNHTVTGTDPNYVVTVTPVNGQREGDAGITIGTQIFDAAGNAFGGAAPEPYILDNTPPSILSITLLDANPTNADSVRFQVEFDGAIDATTFTTDDIVPQGTLAALASASITADANPSFEVTVGLADGNTDGTLGIQVGPNITDAAGNSTSNVRSSTLYTIDNTPPTATIAFTMETVTEADVLGFFVNFNEPVGSSFTAADVTPTGSLAPGASVLVSPAPNDDFFVDVTPANPDQDGTLGITLGTDVFDLAGNRFGGASSPGNYRVDNTPLRVTIALPDPNPTTADSAVFALAWNVEPVGFTANDVNLSGTLAAEASFTFAGSGSNFSVTVTPDDPLADGTLGVEVGSMVTDAEGSPFAGAASPEPYIFDHTAPSTQATAPDGPLSQPGPIVSVEFTVDDFGGGGLDFVELWFRKDGTGDFERYNGAFQTSPIPFSTLLEGGSGSYEIYTIGVDLAGNREEAPAEADITVDLTVTGTLVNFSGFAMN